MTARRTPLRALGRVLRLGVLCTWALAGCAPILPPDVLAEIDRVRAAPAALQAQEQAPAAFAQAEKLRAEARAAFDADDLAGAQIRGERALAAYQEAVATARAVRAERQRLEAASAADQAGARLGELDAAHRDVAAEIAALEDRLEVLRNVEPLEASGAAGTEREQARARAVACLQLEARLLCLAGRLLVGTKGAAAQEPGELADAWKLLDELDRVLESAAAAPIDHAMRARAACLAGLTRVRREGGDDPASGGADALLAELSELAAGPVQRDDRGVVVTLRPPFEGEALSKEARDKLAAVSEVASRHGAFPLQVVIHLAEPADGAARERWRGRGVALVAALRERLGEPRVGDAVMAGAALPLADPRGKHRAHNERVELVFVAP
jgi:hypothetical protein